ncbi:uncharacterized protein LOC110751664 [Prunus avium]|uniref:Uncharacterized protein LOC110751664 n=1 Tax=Prunus avium TaxID=42229 RepID=A0A6P5S1R4_PRUAV|nr:uncharacterized protein LOC110751664 [Prunus avium]
MAFHTLSNSFPSRPHPIIQEVDEHLCRLRSSEAASTSSSSICHKLSALQDLHDCVDKLLLLPLTQQALAKEQNKKWTNELLDGSLRLLDVCSSAKDAILQTKECTIHTKRVACEEETEANEFAQVDAAQQSFFKTSKSDHKNADNQLDNLESSIQDQEELLDCLFRQLIKTRVTLLNILNH